MSICIKEVNKECLAEYAEIPMWLKVTSKYELREIKGGLGGILFEEVNVKEYIKDYSKYENPCEWERKFNIGDWGFFIAYDDCKAVGGLTLAYNTEGVDMLVNRKDMSVLWDIRVSDEYKNLGIGTQLFNSAVKWSKYRNCKLLKIETQNINVPACKFYAKQGSILGEINNYAYDGEENDEVMFMWYLDLN